MKEYWEIFNYEIVSKFLLEINNLGVQLDYV